ncbi:hypothetical protein [Ruegeria sp. HKCCD6119]|uniref:hypothetical protein n=1 Tax=Ruegeria sp. HKCCD6119 TaxID=2683003 RepID=UPI001491D5CD|nr:hypothetical protein [Ruegeria sp. HKCCD6119]NOD83774.1 hypothetical protein [Ruegeria sp. HKCCD6119]
MFQHVLLDNKGDSTELRKRFYSCVYLVADECAPALFYVQSDWSKREALLKIGIDPDNLTATQRDLLSAEELLPERADSENMPRLVCMREIDWDENTDESKLPIRAPTRDFVLSDSELVNKAYLSDNSLNATTVTLSLAAVGLDIMLPNINFDLLATDELERLKETFGEERAAYLSVISDISTGAFERFSDSDHADLIRWAENETMLKLAPKARILEEAVRKAPERTLKSAGASFWREGIPAIGSAYFSGGIPSAGKEAALQSFKAITAAIGGEASKRHPPEYSYAMKIAEFQR